ncbi:MAG: hypothetical protein L0271_03445 [Gemmatimonadetes bacterium]|nr:hypothetical protein [Gemmatimonadota bacterium]
MRSVTGISSDSSRPAMARTEPKSGSGEYAILSAPAATSAPITGLAATAA